MEARATSIGGLPAVNVTYMNERAQTLPASIAGVAYPAEGRYAPVYGGPSYGPLCCPIFSSYSDNGSVVSSAAVNVSGGAEVSSPLAFPSLQEGMYLVRLYVVSPNGTALSAESNMLLEVSSGGSVCGGQEAAGPIFFDSDNGKAYVLDSGTDAVSVIDGNTHSVVSTISLPDLIGQLTFYLYDAGTKGLYVGGMNSNEVFVIDTTRDMLAGRIVVTEPNQSLAAMVYDSNNGKIFGINFVYSIVSVIDPSTNTIVANITGIQGPLGGVFSPKNGDIYVIAYNGTMFAIDGNSYKIVAKVESPSSSNFIYDPDNGLFYSMWNDTLVAFNPATNSFVQTGRIVSDVGSLILYDANNKELYAYSLPIDFATGGTLTAIDPTSGKVVATIPVHGLNGGLVIESPSIFYNPFDGNIYATTLLNSSTGTGALLKISSKTNLVVSQMTLPFAFGSDMAFDSKSGTLYATTSSTVLLADSSSGTLVASIDLGTCPVYYLPP